jgi:hypothetical protein
MAKQKKPAAPAAGAPKQKHWTERISRSGYFFGAVLLHVIIFVMVATWVIFPAFHPPQDEFTKTYLPPSQPPPPPPPSQESVQVPTRPVSTPTQTIVAPSATPTFTVPMPDISPETTPVDVNQHMMSHVATTPNGISGARLAKIAETEQLWGRSKDNIMESGGDPRNVVAKFPVYLASYADSATFISSMGRSIPAACPISWPRSSSGVTTTSRRRWSPSRSPSVAPI